MPNFKAKTIQIHKKLCGKLGVESLMPIKTKADLALAYTPFVAEVSRQIFKNPKLANSLTLKGRTVAVITDGSAVLGLGNLGPLPALPVMEGKCVLFKELGGIDAFPICLNTQNVDEIVNTIKLIAPVFGGINLEDISAPRCFEIEKRLQKELDIPVLHDDQHGTATVVLAALINALKLKKLTADEAKVVINGAGAAGTAATELLLRYGIKHLVVCDSQGIISPFRKNLSQYKLKLAKQTNPKKIHGGLDTALQKADVFIGLSVKNILTGQMIKLMNPKPIIFALANPEPEIHPKLAKQAGAFIVATGRSDYNNQINNVLAFPGIFKGALENKVQAITSQMLINAAKNLSAHIKNISPQQILPKPLDKTVATSVAKAITN